MSAKQICVSITDFTKKITAPWFYYSCTPVAWITVIFQGVLGEEVVFILIFIQIQNNLENT